VATLKIGTEKDRKGNIAILRDDFLGLDSSLFEMLVQALRKVGLRVTLINSEEVAQSTVLSTANFGLLLLSDARTFPAAAIDNLLTYLSNGGNLIALGAPFADKLVWKKEGKWLDREEWRRLLTSLGSSNIICDFEHEDLSAWRRETNNPEFPSLISAENETPEGMSKSMHVSIANLNWWDSYISPHLENPFPRDETVTCFWAKGDERTSHITVEWVERDGARWIASVNLTTKWKYFALSPSEFTYRQDSQTKDRRGMEGDHFNPKNADYVSIGIALPYIGWSSPWAHGSHGFWIYKLGSSTSPLGDLDPAKPIILETLAPSYKFFPIPEDAIINVNPTQAIIKETMLPGFRGFSSSPLPQGTGFLKQRKWRWIPLINAYNDEGENCGTLATLLVHSSPPYKRSAWACFATDKPLTFKDLILARMVADLAARMCEGIYLYMGGSQYYTYFEGDEVRLGATVMNFKDTKSLPLKVRIEVRPKGKREIVFEKEFTFTIDARQDYSLDCYWKPERSTYNLYDVQTELLMNGRIIDLIIHEMGVWKSKPLEKRNYMTYKNGNFYVEGKPWYAHGVNYMPSSGIAIEDQENFEYWVSARSYDPEVIERDLSRIERMGLNTVSVFIYYQSIEAMNLPDLLRRCENHGLKVHLSLRPHADPRQFKWKEVKALITQNRIPENDCVFAYDIAWERGWGTYDGSYGNPKGRKEYDKEWEKWIKTRYSNLKDAETDWGYPVPRKNGKVTGPSNEQLRKDGEWKRMVAAYRRFVDDYTSKIHSHVVRKIRSIDPYHLISFRMSTSGDPTCDPQTFPYDFKGLATTMDIMCPEGYGRIGDWNRIREGCFTVAYARYAAPGKPVLWTEFGIQIWQGTNFYSDPDPAKCQGQFYDDFYRMVLMSGSDGTVCWWYPGGFRVYENSDFGIIEPNGKWRPVSKIMKKYASIILESREAHKPNYWITIDRDEHVDGIFGIYNKVKDEFWKAIDEGKLPGLKTDGTGTNSANAPLIAVGNTEYNGKNPPKYLNSEFNYIQIKNVNGKWVEVNDESRVKVPYNKPIHIRASVRNTEEAEWLSLLKYHSKKGAIYLSNRHGDIEFEQPISQDIPYMSSVDIPEFVLSKGITSKKEVVFELTALDRAWFGEKIKVVLIPT
jgi:hypothetical protein